MMSQLSCSRRGLLEAALGLGAGTLLVAVAGCSPKADLSTQRIKAADVPVGGGVIVGWFVVTQPVAGDFHAFQAVCPHAQLKVGHVEGTAIVCEHHGARFDATSGAVTTAPAKTGLPTAVLVRDGDTLVISAPGK